LKIIGKQLKIGKKKEFGKRMRLVFANLRLEIKKEFEDCKRESVNIHTSFSLK